MHFFISGQTRERAPRATSCSLNSCQEGASGPAGAALTPATVPMPSLCMGSTTRGQVRCRVPDMNIQPNALKRPRRSISQKSFEGRECLASHHIDPGHHSSASEDDGSPDVGHELHAVKRCLGRWRSTLGVSASVAISDRSGRVHLVRIADGLCANAIRRLGSQHIDFHLRG